jgi:parallel beta-helix repeat protein
MRRSLAAAVLLATAALVATTPSAAAPTVLDSASFETSLEGWSAWSASASRQANGVAGAYSIRASTKKAVSTFSVGPAAEPVAATVAGATYTARAAVRTDKPGRDLCLRIRELSGSTVVGSAVTCRTGTTAWAYFEPLSYEALAAGHALDYYVYARSGVRSDSFNVDDATLVVGELAEPVPAPAPPPPAAECTRYAATTGSDADAGTAAAPYRTAQKLVSSLAAGQTGCLGPGIYAEDVTVSTGGSPGAPIVLRSATATRATLLGRLYVRDSANDVVFTELVLNGRNAGSKPSPTVNGDRIVFRGNEITNDKTEICFVLGSTLGYGIAHDVVIDRNRIHDCGAVPATNKDHAIYVESSRNARIINNVIYDNADRGVQLYPDAQGTLVANNVIDGNGQGIIFSGDEGFASSSNVVVDNVITNSTIRYNVESWWPSGNPIGTGNVARLNCVWNGKQGDFDGGAGYTQVDNLLADPLYANRAAKDFRLAAGSPCAGKGPLP